MLILVLKISEHIQPNIYDAVLIVRWYFLIPHGIHMYLQNNIEVGKISCLQWHVPSIELNMHLRDILKHLKPTAEAAASTSVFVHQAKAH